MRERQSMRRERPAARQGRREERRAERQQRLRQELMQRVLLWSGRRGSATSSSKLGSLVVDLDSAGPQHRQHLALFSHRTLQVLNIEALQGWHVRQPRRQNGEPAEPNFKRTELREPQQALRQGIQIVALEHQMLQAASMWGFSRLRSR